MTTGARALGIAESFDHDDDRSTLAGAVIRPDRVVDGLGYATCTVGGLDATDGVSALIADLGRADVGAVLVAGIAPAWFNVLDLAAVTDTADCPVVSVSFEESAGLEPALREQFDGEPLARRLERYRTLPPREGIDAGGTEVFIRVAGADLDTAAAVVRSHTPDGQGRPEPLRVARLAARAARRLRD